MIAHSETKENVLKSLGTDPASGLTADEAKKRLSEYGENRLAEKKGKPKAELHSCCSCPMAASCSLKDSGDKCENEKKEAAE